MPTNDEVKKFLTSSTVTLVKNEVLHCQNGLLYRTDFEKQDNIVGGDAGSDYSFIFSLNLRRNSLLTKVV